MIYTFTGAVLLQQKYDPVFWLELKYKAIMIINMHIAKISKLDAPHHIYLPTYISTCGCMFIIYLFNFCTACHVKSHLTTFCYNYSASSTSFKAQQNLIALTGMKVNVMVATQLKTDKREEKTKLSHIDFLWICDHVEVAEG